MGKIYLGEHLVGLDWSDTGDTFERVSPWKKRVQALHTWEGGKGGGGSAWNEIYRVMSVVTIDAA